MIRVLHQTYRNRHPWKRKYNEDSGHLRTVEQSHDFYMNEKMRKPLRQNLEELKRSYKSKTKTNEKHPQLASPECAIPVSPLLSLKRGSRVFEPDLTSSLGSEIIFFPSLLSFARVLDSGGGGKGREEPRFLYEPNDGKMLAPRFRRPKNELI